MAEYRLIELKARGHLNAILPEHPMLLAAADEIERLRVLLNDIWEDSGGGVESFNIDIRQRIRRELSR